MESELDNSAKNILSGVESLPEQSFVKRVNGMGGGKNRVCSTRNKDS